MMIPMPFLIMWATFTGNPIIVVIQPGAMPVIHMQEKTSVVEPVGNCYSLICKA
jgi:hypothetical protein